MSLLTFSVVKPLIGEYLSYLPMKFCVRDPKLRAAVEEAIGPPLFVTKEPFSHAYRPFAASKQWAKLAREVARMYKDYRKKPDKMNSR
ncbi:MAG TPA: hypothetical protein PLA94_20745 [Myxococcota bacterium]|nr:hypothetical protein [Myxococcota bacterium]